MEEKKINRKAENRKKFFRALFKRKIVIIGAVGVGIFVLMAILAPLIAPYDPAAVSLMATNQGPSAEHLLGTDNFGRDVLSRIIYGARVSLLVGVFAVAIACVIGTFLGMLAAYFGGWVDAVIMRMCEAVMAIPNTVLAMALIAVFGGGMRNLAIILGVSTIPGYVRMMRAQALSTKELDYIMAGKLQGSSNLRLMYKHILPNCLSPIIVMMTQQVGQTILVEAGLSFLGIGISIPTASWGTMVSDGKAFLMTNPVFAISPGVCIALLVICLNLFGDGIRDALDPRLRGEA
ncbi:ABC transporter permease [Hominifimenecus sp. rT4P-3]|uniref:ABC transporter permease n=1 Tax=Hominifimenecus sp. rT4P-3 TaxID=3242979 RepID=UPI003DA6A319